MHRDKKRQSSNSITVAFVLSLGFSILTTVLIFGYLGWLMEQKSGKRYFIPLGVLLGLIMALNRAYRAFKALSRE
jgi:F0F1-type ATP synthase assembly protein I